MAYNKKIYYGGHFDNEEHAAMKINLFCDKYGIERKHLMINIDLHVIQRVIMTFIYIHSEIWKNKKILFGLH